MHSGIYQVRHVPPSFTLQNTTLIFGAGSWDAYAIIAVCGITNRLYYCVTFLVYTKFTGMAAVRPIQLAGTHAASGPWVGDQ
jgi:hypothetical protein